MTILCFFNILVTNIIFERGFLKWRVKKEKLL